MSKREEILHKLSTDDRNYIKENIKELKHEISVLEKALELACDKIGDLLDPCGEPENAWFYDFDGGVVERKGFENCYKSQAEKEVKDAI